LFAAYFEGFFKRYHNDMGVPDSAVSSTVTGILLVLQNTCIHLLEVHSTCFKHPFIDVAGFFKSNTSTLAGAKHHQKRQASY
jgi:hypothetical protein